MNTQKCISDADLARLWEGDVTPQEKQALQQHIEICSDCRTRWQQASAGAKRLDDLFTRTAKKVQTAGECLSEDLLAGFVNQALGQTERDKAEEHLAQCSRCRDALADKFADAYAKNGDKWWSEYAAGQMLELLAMVPDRADELVEPLDITKTVESERAVTIIKLPILEPVENQARRLAAATGEGFSTQTLRQDEPAFEFELAQFGQQLRITAQSLEKDSPYKNCLARLKLYEENICKWSQVILIEKGKARCIVEPEEVGKLRPQQKHLSLKLEPIVTLGQLTAAGSEAYRPILSKLLKHKEPEIRCAAVKVAVRIYGPDADSLIKPHANDENLTVRETVQKALKGFAQS